MVVVVHSLDRGGRLCVMLDRYGRRCGGGCPSHGEGHLVVAAVDLGAVLPDALGRFFVLALLPPGLLGVRSLDRGLQRLQAQSLLPA